MDLALRTLAQAAEDGRECPKVGKLTVPPARLEDAGGKASRRVEQDLRPVMAAQGAEGSAYRMEEGSTSCREQDRSPGYLVTAI